jgi:hypothetical protein
MLNALREYRAPLKLSSFDARKEASEAPRGWLPEGVTIVDVGACDDTTGCSGTVEGMACNGVRLTGGGGVELLILDGAAR